MSLKARQKDKLQYFFI